MKCKLEATDSSLLQNLLFAQDVSCTIMPIIRSGMLTSSASRKPDTQPTAPRQTDNLKTKAPSTTSSSHLYNTLELLMMGMTSSASRKPDTQPTAPRQTDNLKTKAPSTTSSSHVYNTLELLMMDIMVPETC
jgi:hypothetical protein